MKAKQPNKNKNIEKDLGESEIRGWIETIQILTLRKSSYTLEITGESKDLPFDQTSVKKKKKRSIKTGAKNSTTHGTVDKGGWLDPVIYPKSVSSIHSEGSRELSAGKLTGDNW